MYKNIFVAVDNSPFSEGCCAAAVSLARVLGAHVTGCHVYAARMHERRFRQMEASLPEEYLQEGEMERQRAIHESLIALGLRLISDAYLDALERRCRESEIPFTRKLLEGKNWERLAEEITGSTYDLVVTGARGHGTVLSNTIGSVCLRVLRRTRVDTLVVKEPTAFEDGLGRPIVVALDGSKESFGSLQAALALGKIYKRPVEAIAAYDPYFHYAVFHDIVQVLSKEAARVFRFAEQERLHEEIIDSGLARFYQTQLEVAQHLADAEGMDLKTTLLAGRACDEVLAYAERTRPWLLFAGRIGAHSREDMDIGSVTEHLLRFAHCNLMVASRRFSPPLELWGRVAVRWTDEAEAVLQRVPEGFRGALRLLVHRLAMEQGHSVVTAVMAKEVLKTFEPPGRTVDHMHKAALAVATEVLGKEQTTIHLCPQCGHAARERKPVACPVCRQDGQLFLTIERQDIRAIAESQGGVVEEAAFDGSSISWSQAALEVLKRVPDPYERNRARLRIEKATRLAKIPVVTQEFALRIVPDMGQKGTPAG